MSISGELGYTDIGTAPMGDSKDVTLRDGSQPMLGARVRRLHPEDGTARAGKPYGPILTIHRLRDEATKPGGQPVPNARAVLRNAHTKAAAGTAWVWELSRVGGTQPRRGEKDKRDMPRMRVRGEGEPGKTMVKTMVSSIRIGNELREQLAERGDEISAVIRRDLMRLYEMLAESRERLIFPAGTLAVLARAWTMAAPPPPYELLRPQWFIPVLQNACHRIGEEASELVQFIATWTPLDALAVQDIVERFTPEESGADRLIQLGLRECPPDAPGRPQKPKPGNPGRRVDGIPTSVS